MIFSKNRARILPDLRLQQAGIFAAEAPGTTFVANFGPRGGKAFAGCWQKAKLDGNQC
ncbi:hypothetical protein M1B34_20130 [Pseudomonas sp. MAFF 302030]|uniref:Uncharacterized protein n=1 Tax=Pseudomonas morbosilactucae TaxID=2938197 RepID=A0A9X1YXJ1_9PSED|nr:hypothetical protein [Pseudomonas morbosilactucae]MCK9799947.1 hypothetical protein [Pseudomonas morbosilactucae]MCK9816691.1 hypothetical protein [Pseudomonas morbosilactucae]WEK11546.1 MAG: hypothetical protein P0Y51_12795 [Pseudomonas sp.]